MENRAARRYARALFNLSRESDSLDAVCSDMRALEQLLEESDVFRRFTLNPLIPADSRTRTLAALFEDRLGTIALTFLQLLQAKGRLALLGDICRHFGRLYDDAMGIMHVTVRSAHPLSDTQVEAIGDKLKARLGKEVIVAHETDPALLGGFSVQAGDHIYDSTAATLLDRFKQTLIHAS